MGYFVKKTIDLFYIFGIMNKKVNPTDKWIVETEYSVTTDAN